jgi:ribosomal protein S27AE
VKGVSTVIVKNENTGYWEVVLVVFREGYVSASLMGVFETLEEAKKKVESPKCPKCGSLPDMIDNEEFYHCSGCGVWYREGEVEEESLSSSG